MRRRRFTVDAAHHPRVDRAEMLRYLGYGGQQIEPELSHVLSLWSSTLSWTLSPWRAPRICRRCHGRGRAGEPSIRLVGTNVELRGRDIYRHLKDARFAALMACTLGMDAERRLRTTGAQQPLEGAVLDAACSAYVCSRRRADGPASQDCGRRTRTRRQLALLVPATATARSAQRST